MAGNDPLGILGETASGDPLGLLDAPVQEKVTETVTETPSETSIPTVTMDANDGLVPEGSGEFDIKNPTKATGVINIPKGGAAGIQQEVYQEVYQDKAKEYIKNAKTEIRSAAMSVDFGSTQNGFDQPSVPNNPQQLDDYAKGVHYLANPEEQEGSQVSLTDEQKGEIGAYAEKVAAITPAIQKSIKSLEKNPDDINELNTLGDGFINLEDNASALSAYSKAIGISPNWKSFQGLGATYYQLGDVENAKKAFTESYNMNQDEPLPLSNLANIDINTGDLEAAQKKVDEMKAKFPDYSVSYGLSARLKAAKGDIKGAEADNQLEELRNWYENIPDVPTFEEIHAEEQKAAERLKGISDAVHAVIEFIPQRFAIGPAEGVVIGAERFAKGAKGLDTGGSASDVLDMANGVVEVMFSGGMGMAPMANAKFLVAETVTPHLVEAVMKPLDIGMKLLGMDKKELTQNQQGMVDLGNALASIVLLGAVHGKGEKFSPKEVEKINNLVKAAQGKDNLKLIETFNSMQSSTFQKAKDILGNSTLSEITRAATSYNSIPKDISDAVKIEVFPDVIEIERLETEKKNSAPAFHPYIDKKIEALSAKVDAQLNEIVGKSEEAPVKAEEAAPNLLENESVKEEMAYIEEEISSSKESDSKKGVLGRMLSSGNKYLKEKKEELALIKSDPIAYFEKKLKDEQDWAKENPEDAYPNTINRYKTILSELKGSEKKVEPTSKVEAIKKPTFENVPVFTRTPEEIEFAKNEVFNNLSKLEIGSVIENSDGEIKVVTENSIDKKGNQLIGVITYERQADGSLRQMTNIVWAEKKADGKIKLEYSPHLTGTNSKGERVTVTDQITDKKIDLSKENIFAEDKDGNLIQVNKVEPKAEVKEVLIPEYSEKLKDVSPETKVVDLPDGISVEFNGEKGTIGRSETGETLFINAEGKETIVGGGGDVSTLAEKGISRTEGTYSDKRGDYYVKDGRVFEVTKDGLKPVYEGEKANVERKEAIIRKALNPEKPKEKIVEPVVEEKPIEVKLEEIKTEPVAETVKVADAPSSRPIEKFESEVAFEEAGSGHNVLFTDKDGKKSVVGKVFGTEGKTGAEFDSWVKPQIEAIHYKEVVKAVERGDVVPKEVLDHYLSSKIEGDYNGMLAEAIKSVKENGPKKEIFSEQEIGEVMDKRAEELSQMKRTKDYVFQLIHDNFDGISLADWTRYGDANWLKGKEGRAFKKKYIKENGLTNLEENVVKMSEEANIDIQPQDVIDYIMDREMNPKKYDGRLKQWNDAASIPKKDVPSLLSGDDAMVLSIAESNRGLGMTDLEVDTIKRYVESKAKNEARAKNTKPRSAESAPKSEGSTAKSERVGRKPGEKAQKKKDEAKSVKAEESKYVEAEKKITKIFDTLRAKLIADLPEGTEKMGLGMEDLLNAAEKVIIGAIRAGEKIDVAISKGLDHLKEKWDDSFGEFPEKELRDILKENGEIQLSHEKTDALREKYGMEEREINDPVSTEKTRAEAQKIIKKGFDVIKLANEVIKKERTITPVERAILAERVAILDKELLEGDTTSPEYAKKMEEQNKLIKASEISASQAGSSLGSIAHIKVVADESLSGYFQEQRRVNKEGALTEKQTATNKKEFEEITKVKEAYEKRIAKIQEENNRLKAEKQLEKLAKKTSKRTAKEKLDEDFDLLAKEFSSIAKNTLNAGINPELIPVVLKMVKNRVEKGVITLSEVVDAVHEKVGEFGISKEDIIAAIAGKHGPERTRSDAAKNLYELKQEAKLVQKLTDLQNGKEPSSERGKVQKNARLEELRKQIKEHDLTKTAEYKKRLDAQIAEVERELATGDFAVEEKKEPLKLDKETLELQDKYMQLSMEREARLLREEYAQRSMGEKAADIGMSIMNAPMTLMSSGDLSAVLRQGLVASTSHPILAARASKRMLKFFKSQKDFDRWHFETKNDPRYLQVKEAGLAIVDPHDPKLAAREEAFMGNIVEKIPIYGSGIRLAKIKDGKLVRTEGEYGGLVKASERAYVGFLNKMRWDVYNLLSERLEKQGITFENNPTLYKELASHVNNITGRGNIPKKMERLSPALNAAFFSPRLWASRLKLLSNWANPLWYKKVPKEVRRFYWEDMGKFAAAASIAYLLSSAGGADVETDIRSSDFLKIRNGKKRYDILGGFQQPIRTLGQYATGQKKDIDSGEITELTDSDKSLPNRLLEQKRLAVLLQHIRGKLSPVPAAFTDFGMGRMMDYSEPTVEKEIMRMIVPLAWQDIVSAYGEEGAKSFVTTALPTILGVSNSIYKDPEPEPKEKPKKASKPKKKRRVFE